MLTTGESLTSWLDTVVRPGRRGRKHTFSDAAIQVCRSIKCLFGLALRESLGLVGCLLRMAVQEGS